MREKVAMRLKLDRGFRSSMVMDSAPTMVILLDYIQIGVLAPNEVKRRQQRTGRCQCLQTLPYCGRLSVDITHIECEGLNGSKSAV